VTGHGGGVKVSGGFLTPPATLSPHDRLHAMLHDTLRGSGLDHMRFVDRVV
jgi:hypothetical protein